MPLALCADVDVAKHEGGVAMDEDIVYEIVVINEVVEVADVETVAYETTGAKEEPQ